MADPCSITVAITGSLPGKMDNSAVPIFPTRVYENSPELVDWLAASRRRSGTVGG